VDWVLPAVLLLGVFLATAPGAGPAPQRLPAPARRLQVIGYFENGQGGIFVSSFPALRRNERWVDTVSPFWYSVDWEGKVVFPRELPDVIEFTRQRGLRLIPLVNNVVVPGGENDRMLATPEARANTVANLVRLVEDQGYHGLNVYFPWLGPDARAAFTAFITDLARELHQRDRVLGVSVYPREDADQEVHGHFDYAALAAVADYIVLMAYDHHWEQSEAGPTAPRPWVEQNLRSALRDIPAERLVLAVGMFGYDWTVPAGRGLAQYLPATAAADRARRLGVTVRRDDESGQPRYTYTERQIRHEVWYEDAQSFRDKLDLALAHDLGGIALWRLGFEEPAVWTAIDDRLGVR
jgi:spore germination protein YaaH